MKTTMQTLSEGYEYSEVLKYFRHVFGDNNQYELAFEPLIYGNMYVALYENGELISDKVVVRPME